MISIKQSRFGARVSGLLTAGAIAGLAAALGCVRLGVFGVTSMLVGRVQPSRSQPPESFGGSSSLDHVADSDDAQFRREPALPKTCAVGRLCP